MRTSLRLFLLAGACGCLAPARQVEPEAAAAPAAAAPPPPPDTGPVFGPLWIEHARAGGVLVVQPDEYDFVPVLDNAVLPYDIALRHSSGRVELRVAVQPVAAGEVGDPEARFAALLAEVADEVVVPVSVYPPDAVGRDYRADWGAIAVIRPKPAFSADYPQALAIGLHRHGRALAWLLFLCLDPGADAPVIDPAISAFTFKGPFPEE